MYVFGFVLAIIPIHLLIYNVITVVNNDK